MTRNAPLYFLAVFAAALSGFIIPSVLLWGAWWLLEQGQWLFALAALVALVGYVETLWVAVLAPGRKHAPGGSTPKMRSRKGLSRRERQKTNEIHFYQLTK